MFKLLLVLLISSSAFGGTVDEITGSFSLEEIPTQSWKASESLEDVDTQTTFQPHTGRLPASLTTSEDDGSVNEITGSFE